MCCIQRKTNKNGYIMQLNDCKYSEFIKELLNSQSIFFLNSERGLSGSRCVLKQVQMALFVGYFLAQ